MSGILYLVATPIGNLEDITIRALNTLKNVDIIAAEDTRHTLGLLNHFEIKKPLISYYKEIEKSKSQVLINELLDGKNIALVSDAGTPGISDPGEEIVKVAIENGIQVVPIPGACALINALIASGLATREFEFIGFLDGTQSEKRAKLNELLFDTRTMIFYEAPHRIESTLNLMKDVFGEDRRVVVAKELTKIHEYFYRGKLSTISEQIVDFKGEYVIIIEGSKLSKKENEINNLSNMDLDSHYEYYNKKGMDKKDIIKQIAKDRNVSKNEIYQYFIKK